MNAKVVIAAMAIGLWVTGLARRPGRDGGRTRFQSQCAHLRHDFLWRRRRCVDRQQHRSGQRGRPVHAGQCQRHLGLFQLPVELQLGTLTGSGPQNGGWWSFGSGGTISITGGVQLQGGTDIPSGSTLLTGSFNNAFVQDLGAQGFKVTFGSFSDTKNADLLSYYGLTPGTPFQGALTLLFAATDNGAGSPFTSTSVFSGNVVNAPATVPLPAAALLFGSGLIGLAGTMRKKFGFA